MTGTVYGSAVGGRPAVGVARVTVAAPAPTNHGGEASGRHPAMRLGRWRFALLSMAAAATALPLLTPQGPGNTGVVDVAMVVAIVAAVLWAAARRHVVRVPYAIPVAVAVLAGAIGAAESAIGGATDGANSAIALAQDVFLLLWAAALATLGQDRRLLDVFCRAWAYSAAAWAAVLIIAASTGLNWLAGISPEDGIRASFTLGDPNLAASYFTCSLLVLRAVRRPRCAPWRWLLCALLVTAIVLTLSNGGMLVLFLVTLLGAVFGLARRRGTTIALAFLAFVLVGTAALASTVDLRGNVTRLEELSPLVRDSLGRESESGSSRSTLAKENLALWLRDDSLVGFGPANTLITLRQRQAAYVKEAHNDYLATLLERGVLGGVALVMLATAIAVRCRRICAPQGVAPAYRDVVPRPELLAAAMIGIGVSAMFYEVLHFRHMWSLLGVIAALELTGRRS
jgi:hypothetical protein